MKRKGMKNIVKVVSALGFTALCAMLFFGVNGEAYIDPSVMTYMIQAIAGLIIAVGAVVGIYFRRAKKKLNETLNIDENRNKEVESDEILVDDAGDTDKTGDTGDTFPALTSAPDAEPDR